MTEQNAWTWLIKGLKQSHWDPDKLDLDVIQLTTKQRELSECQAIYALAFVGTTEQEQNPYFQHPACISYIRALFEHIKLLDLPNDKTGICRRIASPLIKAFDLVYDQLEQADVWANEIHQLMESYFYQELSERAHLSYLSSANVGYGTNHLAVELDALATYYSVFNKHKHLSLPNKFAASLQDFLIDYLKRFMHYMDEGGYWPEADGPTYMYNSLTATALLGVAHSLDCIDEYRDAFQQASQYHAEFLLPNFVHVGIVDGRNRQPRDECGGFKYKAFLGFSAEGRALLQALHHCDQEHYQGDDLVCGIQEILLESQMAAPAKALSWEQKERQYAMRDDFLVHQQGSWVSAYANFAFRPRPEGHWNLDYQNCFSLYHKSTGVIFEGSNSKNNPEMSSFHKFLRSFDGMPIDPAVPKYIPEKGTLSWDAHSVHLHRPYRGFEGVIDTRVLSENKFTVHLRAYASLEHYPITACLLLRIGLGNHFIGANGQQYQLLKDNELRLTSEEVGAYIDIPKCDEIAVRIHIPDGSEVIWPFKAWDCYNLNDSIQKEPEDWDCLLHIPVTHLGQDCIVEIRDNL